VFVGRQHDGVAWSEAMVVGYSLNDSFAFVFRQAMATGFTRTTSRLLCDTYVNCITPAFFDVACVFYRH